MDRKRDKNAGKTRFNRGNGGNGGNVIIDLPPAIKDFLGKAASFFEKASLKLFTEEELLSYISDDNNLIKIINDPKFIGLLADNINKFEEKYFIDRTLQIFGIALDGPQARGCLSAIIKSKFLFNIKERIINDYRFPNTSLLDILCEMAEKVKKFETIKIPPEKKKALNDRIEEIIATNEIEFIRYAAEKKFKSAILLEIIIKICEKIAQGPRGYFNKNNDLGRLLTMLLWKYEKNSKICKSCLVSLSEITFKGERDEHKPISNLVVDQISKYAGSVVKAMRRHIKHIELLRNGFKVISNIAFNKHAVRHIMDEGFIGIVHDSQDDVIDVGTYRYWRARALWELSKNPSSKEKLEKDNKIVGTMIEGLLYNLRDTKFAYPCCAFLESIEINDDFITFFKECGVMGCLEEIIKHSNDNGLKEKAASLIGKVKPRIRYEDGEIPTGDNPFSHNLSCSDNHNPLTVSVSKFYYQGIDQSTMRQSCILCCEKTEPDFYIPFEESLREAGFENINSILKYTREIAVYLRKKGTLEKYDMSEADAMSIAAYTYDNGSKQLEKNIYRVVNKTVAERNTNGVLKFKGYLLHFLAALRKLGSYNGPGPLYRALSGRINPMHKKRGQELTWSAFTSTSLDERAVIDFINTTLVDKRPKYIFEIIGCFKNSHKISEFSFHSGEEEIIFEPGTRVKVIDCKPDPNVTDCTRIVLEVLDTPPVLREVVGAFRAICKKNLDKENYSFDETKDTPAPMYRSPIVLEKHWKDIWIDVQKCFRDYMPLKSTFMFMGKESMKELLLGFKKLAIDDEFGEAADMMKGYQLSIEDGAALYSYSYKYGESGSLSLALNSMFCERKSGLSSEGVIYLLYLTNALQKLPEWKGSPQQSDDEAVLYVAIGKNSAWRPIEKDVYVLDGIVAGKVERPKCNPNEYLLCIKNPKCLHGREVGPLTVWKSSGYIFAGPGGKIRVDSVETDDYGICAVTATAIDIVSGVKSTMDMCLEKFARAAPLPDEWTIEEDEDSKKLFYQNKVNDKTQWARPVLDDPSFFTDFECYRSEPRQQTHPTPKPPSHPIQTQMSPHNLQPPQQAYSMPKTHEFQQKYFIPQQQQFYPTPNPSSHPVQAQVGPHSLQPPQQAYYMPGQRYVCQQQVYAPTYQHQQINSHNQQTFQQPYSVPGSLSAPQQAYSVPCQQASYQNGQYYHPYTPLYQEV